MLAKKVLASAVIGTLATLAQAQDASMFKISGFGTLAATAFSRSDIDFLGDRTATGGAGHTSRLSMEPDSKLGIQAQFTPISALQFTFQALSRSNARGNWDPSIEWANAKYSFNDNIAVRVGRIGHPFFMISDYRQVNYTNVALRPSVEVYHQVPLTNSDVVEALVNFPVGSGQLSLQGGVGKIDAEAYASLPSQQNHDEIKARNLAYLNANYEVGAWTFRAGYTAGKLSYDALAARRSIFEPLSRISALTGSGVPQSIRDRFEIKNARSSFSGIGMSYDPGNFVITGEYVMLRSEKAYNDTDAWTVLAGYRLGKFTPYVSYGSSKNKGKVEASGVAASLTPFVGPTQAGAIQAGLQGYADATLNNQSTASLGVRWDVYKNLALKAQYDHVNVKSPGANGFLFNSANVTDSRYNGGDGDVFAVSLDFIF